MAYNFRDFYFRSIAKERCHTHTTPINYWAARIFDLSKQALDFFVCWPSGLGRTELFLKYFNSAIIKTSMLLCLCVRALANDHTFVLAHSFRDFYFRDSTLNSRKLYDTEKKQRTVRYPWWPGH